MATKPPSKVHHTKRYRETNTNDLKKAVVVKKKTGNPVFEELKAKNPALVGQRGGPGRGQGRKPNRARTAAEQLQADLINGRRVIKEAGDELPDAATPLDVMLMAMKSAYKLGGSLMAFPYAEKAAPYLHARIAQIQLKPADDGSKGGLVFGWLSDVQRTPAQDAEVVDGVTKLLD